MVNTPWGELTMTFDGCNAVRIEYTSNDFGNGTLNMERLTKLGGIRCEE